MIQITSKSRYAVCALAELIGAGGVPGGTPVPVCEIARRRDVPAQFLEQLFASLRRAGILASRRGIGGGYVFARDPREVTALEVVELLDGEQGVAPQPGKGECPKVFQDAARALRDVLASRTIADVADQQDRARRPSMYYI